MSLVAVPLLLAAQNSAFTPNGFPLRQDEDEVRMLYYVYGNCVVGRFPRAASEAILDNVDDQTLIKRRRALVEPDCLKPAKGMSIFMGLQADRIRYSVADALVRKELRGEPVRDFSAVPKLSHWDAGEPPKRLTGNAKGHEQEVRQYQERYAFAQFSRYGECVVRTDSSNARALLLAEPTSKPESAAFAALKPALAHCLPDGQTLAFTRLTLRGTIAVNYYRLAKAALGTARLAGDAK